MDFLLLIYNRESYSENLKEVIKNIFTRFRFLLTKLCVSFVENIDLRQEKLIYDGDKKYVFLYKMFLIFCQEKYYSPTSLISIISITPAYSAAKPSEEGPWMRTFSLAGMAV